MRVFSFWGRQAARKVLERELPTMVKAEFERQLDLRLPSIIEDILRDRFRDRPNDPVSELGFNWALALSLRAYWPDVSNQDAVRWLREYIEVPYGHSDYDWSPAAAQLIAKEYVEELGEVA